MEALMGLLSKPELVIMAVRIAREFGLDPALICAHIDVRSKWDSGFAQPTAISYLIHQNFPDPRESEWRSIQWGLMGISGEFARVQNYTGLLPALLDPSLNLQVGCRLLSQTMQSKIDHVERYVQGLTSWNTENNREFAVLTLSKLETYRELIRRLPELQAPFQSAQLAPELWAMIAPNELYEVGYKPPHSLE
jgi:hypothetical protein